MKRILLAALAFCLLHVHASAQSTGGQRSPVLLPADGKTIDSLRAAAKGRVLVLNFWATWCKPCVEEFPHLVQLQREYASRGLELVFVSVDEDDARTTQRVRAFLKKMGLTTPSFLKRSGDDETFINAVHPKWSGAVPTTFVYNKRGDLVAMKVEELSFGEVEKIVAPLLAQ